MRSISRSFRLSPEAVRALAELVAWGRAPSQTALLEELIGREARRLRLEQEERRMDLAWRDAMQDPAFRLDLESVEVDFQPLDAEAWPSR